MAVVGDNRGGRDTPVAVLEDARKRREQRPDPQLTPCGAQADEPTEDLTGYALSLADSVRSADDDHNLVVSPDDTSGQHEAAPQDAPAQPAMFEQTQPIAHEIFLELQASSQREQPPPTAASPPPILAEPSRKQRRRAPLRFVAGRREHPAIMRRRAVIVSTVIVIATAVPIIAAASGSNPRAHPPQRQNAVGVTTTPESDSSLNADRNLGTLAAANYQARENRKPQRRASSATLRRHRRAHPQGTTARVKRAGTMHPVNARPASTTATSAPASSQQSTTSPSASVASSSSSSAQQSSNTPAPSQPVASQSAGPTGYGHVVGSNCNPQCH
jgi:hypothetical protein